MNLGNKIIVITGGSSGIGKSVALEAVRCGAAVAIIARNKTNLDNSAKEITEITNKPVFSLSGDVANMREMQLIFQTIEIELGRIDVLINCAGINIRKSFFETSEDDWDEVIRVNLKGTFVCCRLAAEIMRKQNYGAIINVSSVGAKRGATSPHYSASKAGIHGLSANLAKELAPYGIRVNVVAPGPIDDTRMAQEWTIEKREQLEKSIPLHRLGKPMEVAKAILFLASDDASFITGEILDVNGGMLID